jgi:MerR family Zn(II)-responsive transcriptional regulator of zntA
MYQTSNSSQVRIGELAAELGLNPKTIRYYEEVGLLPKPERACNGYRLYGDPDRERLRFIGKAKAVGLRLAEIGEVLALRRDGEQPCEHVVALLDRKLDLVEEQLRTLLSFKQELRILREEAYQTMRADAYVCGIIERHEDSHKDS